MTASASEGRVGAVVVAAGLGTRFLGGGPPKQYRDICGEPMLLRALRPFLAHPRIHQVIAVLPADDSLSTPPWLEELPVVRVSGGPQRSDSVRNGLAALEESIRTVLVHDGARPLLTSLLLDRVIAASGEEAVIPVIPVTDTVKEVDADGRVIQTVPRERLWRVQTPQGFPADTFRRLHGEAAAAGFAPTDDAGLFERYGLPVRIVEGDPANIKVTTQMDLIVAEALARRLRDPTC